MEKAFSINSAVVEKHFDKAASTFDDAAFVHAITREGVFDRMQPMVVEAKTVLDLGCGTGAAIKPLSKRFRGARIIGVDHSRRMIDRCRKRRLWLTKSSFVNADACSLPFADNSIDVVFSNLLLPWIDDIPTLGRELARVLRKDGLFGFSTLGPDTLGALRDAWEGIDRYEHVNRFIDMHDVGDSLSKSGLREPVLDVDRLTVTYNNGNALFRDLSASGARNALRGRAPRLTAPATLDRVRRKLEKHGKFSIELEIIYGHCWGSGTRAGDGGVRIDAGRIPVRRR